MKSGLTPLKTDHRDYSYHKSFGTTTSPTFPLEFSVDVGLWMPNQMKTQAFTGMDTIPPLPYGCTDYAQCDLCVNEDVRLYNPLDLEAVTHANANRGGDMRVALKAAIQLFGRTAYFNITRAEPLDWYDSLRLVMLSTPEEKRAISIGVPWFPEFQSPLDNGTLATPTNYILTRASWHNAVVSGWDGRGLKIKSLQGPEYGDHGWCYMPRALINVLMDMPGACAFTLTKEKPAQVFRIDTTYVQWFVSLIRNLFKV